MLISIVSILSGIEHTIDVPCTLEEFAAFCKGARVQDAMPNLAPHYREFILTGMDFNEQAVFYHKNLALARILKRYADALKSGENISLVQFLFEKGISSYLRETILSELANVYNDHITGDDSVRVKLLKLSALDDAIVTLGHRAMDADEEPLPDNVL